MKRGLLAFVIFFLIVALGLGLNLFVIGEPADGEQLMCSSVLTEEGLRVRAETPESGMALRGWEHWQEGAELHIRGWKVPVSPWFRSGSYEAVVDVTGTDRVYIGGRLIWQR